MTNENLDGLEETDVQILIRSHYYVFQRLAISSLSFVRVHKKHCMVLETPSQVKDVRSWLQLYGEPDPKRVPTGEPAPSIPSSLPPSLSFLPLLLFSPALIPLAGVMSTFRPSRVRFGKDKSRSSDMIRKVSRC